MTGDSIDGWITSQDDIVVAIREMMEKIIDTLQEQKECPRREVEFHNVMNWNFCEKSDGSKDFSSSWLSCTPAVCGYNVWSRTLSYSWIRVFGSITFCTISMRVLFYYYHYYYHFFHFIFLWNSQPSVNRYQISTSWCQI